MVSFFQHWHGWHWDWSFIFKRKFNELLQSNEASDCDTNYYFRSQFAELLSVSAAALIWSVNSIKARVFQNGLLKTKENNAKMVQVGKSFVLAIVGLLLCNVLSM